MESATSKQTVLVISYGPVPTPQHQTVEGGGMRCWGLATGLTAHGYEVTVGINDSFALDQKEHQGISLVNWSLNEEFADLINSFDAIIMSYCMGDPSVFVIDKLAPEKKLILDLYVPIYVEVSARDSKDVETEYKNYLADIERFNLVLKRGDYFLCANAQQKLFYTGVLSSLGIINPSSYRDQRLLVVPFGVERTPAVAKLNPYTKLGIKTDAFVLLWFGGLYPWFKIDSLLESVKNLPDNLNLKLVIVGGRNPFNSNPDFTRQYEYTVEYATKNNLLDKTIFFVDWVDYADRINWYKHADTVISINTPGEENYLSWRTRVIDYVWGELVIITNGSDPLSELLLENQAAIRLPSLSEADITATLQTVLADPSELENVRQNLLAVKEGFYWDVVTEPVTRVLENGEQHYLKDKNLRAQLRIQDQSQSGESKTLKVAKKVRKLAGLARRKGIRRSAAIAIDVLRRQSAARASPARGSRKFIFISHPLDNTGAPLVLLDVIRDFAAQYGGSSIQVVAQGAFPQHVRTLRQLGIRLTRAAEALGGRFLKLQMPIKYDDFVLINTVAIYGSYRDYIFGLLEDGSLKHVYWFIHEDTEQLSLVGQDILAPHNISRIKKLANQGKLTILTPSDRISKDYAKLFETTNVKSVKLRVTVDEKYMAPRKPADFNSIRFVISGNPVDGRKGQFLALTALYTFEKEFRAKDPGNYRDFNLSLIAVGDDYVSRQIKSIGQNLFGERFKTYPVIPREQSYEIFSRHNATICCSLNETFALYVAEGMLMGHVLLRNDTAGREEQLQDGVNGYLINDDVMDFASKIEKLLNRKTTNQQLTNMGTASQKIALQFTQNSYLEQIEVFDKLA